MVTENKGRKVLRLGNWQIFLLDKLNQLFLKGDLCDVTLKFIDNTSLQVHRVMLTACTNFFDLLPSSSSGEVLHMPKTMTAVHVRPVINFMYTGRLEYNPDEYDQIYTTASQLGMSVLTELLQVQEQQQPQASANRKEDMRGFYRKYVHKHTPNMQQTKLKEEDVSSNTPPPAVNNTTPTSLPGKKLPIWKKRSTIQLPEEFYRSNDQKLPPPEAENPRPTRFEWPEEEELPEVNLSQNFTMDSFENISYDSKVIRTPVHGSKPVISEDSIEMMPETTRVVQHRSKRIRDSEVVRGHADEDDDYDDGHFETIHDLDDDLDEDEQATSNEFKPVNTPPKPILKTVSTPTPSKKVRFAFSSDNDSSVTNDKKTPPPLVRPTPEVVIPSKDCAIPVTSCPTSVTSITNTSNLSSINHTKIINEIIKKYPDLVKNNKNIKLKIQTGGSPLPGSLPASSVLPEKDAKGQKKVQYVVLRSELTNIKKDAKNDVPSGAENRTGPWDCIPCGDEKTPLKFDTYYAYRRHLQEVHNERIDARICEHCGFKASKRNLHLYHLYTKHNIPPPRNINFPKCDQCNYIALSESLLIKHRSNHTGLLSKEFVCRICNAAFKSNGALMGHMQTNLHQIDQAVKKDYSCEVCGKIFNRNINLKAHIRTHHQNRKLYDDEDRVDDPPQIEETPLEQENHNVMEVIEVPVFDSTPGGSKTLYLPQGMTILAESPSVPLMPSSESEAMNNVATGIATSINITDRNIPNDVIVIDANSEIILRSAPSTYVVNQDGSYSLQEYIVPEIMTESGQVYTTALVSSAPSSGLSYVNSDSISIVTSSSDHTYADGMKINGHINSGTHVNLVSPNQPTVITAQGQTPQSNQPIIVQEPILMNADWVQTISTSQAQGLNLNQAQKIEIISGPVPQIPQIQTQSQEIVVTQAKTAQNLVSDWGDLEEETQEESQDGEDESEMKPSRPTIELDVNHEMDM